MKIALITDTHFGARNDSEVLADYFEKFYLEVFFPYLKEKGISEVIHLGDAFDRRKYINFQSLNRCKYYFYEQIVQNDLILHQIVGNHDTFYKNTNDVNAPRLLLNEYSGYVRVYQDPEEVTIGGKKTVFMPWICADNSDRALELIENSSADVLFGHLELDGFEMYRGAPHHGGMSASVFSKFHAVFSGHFHHRSSNRNIHYLGCPYEMTWSDYNDPKGFHVFDTDTNELTFVENPYRLFHKVKYNDVNWTDADYIKGFDFSDLKSTYVKVIVTNKTNPYWFDLFIDKLEKADPIQVQIVDDNLNLDVIEEEDVFENIDDTFTILQKSIENIPTEVDKTQLDTFLKSLYNEALNIE